MADLVTDLPVLPPRPRDAHKGTFGRVLVVAGSRGMSGAAVLCASGALRGGAGLVFLAVPEALLPLVAPANPCYLTVPLPADPLPVVREQLTQATVAVIGPGLGQGDEVAALLTALLPETPRPLLLDADALNLLAGRPDLLKAPPGPRILTPHPGEFARLTGQTTAGVQQQRADHAVAFAARHGVVLVLKGAGTIVTDGRRLYTNTTGNPGMATGGTGDVLAGLIGALVGQGLAPFEAAQLGVYLHGRAGDLGRDKVGEVSLIATDLLDHLPAAFKEKSA